MHEMSVANPLFRFYLAYLFPILKGIEEGTEYYLDPRRMPRVPGLRLVAVHTMTFVPDFVPQWALGPAVAIERWLERSRRRGLGAHFVATYQRDDA